MTRTLSSFDWLLKADKHVVQCPQMFLDGWHDHQAPLFEGSGRFTVDRAGGISFQLDAKPREAAAAMAALRRLTEEPYASDSAIRLRGIDYAGTEWNAGWVRPRLGEIQGTYWQLFGECGVMSTSIQQGSASDSVELVYSPPPELPFTEAMKTTAHLGDTEIGWRRSGGRHKTEVLGSQIEVATEPWTDELWICASTSEDLQHPYLENWLSEPLRALRGQLIYPRLVARNFSDGRAFVTLRDVPLLKRTMGGCASQLKDRSAAEFWAFYEKYLVYVAQHRDKRGSPEFEANSLTRLHDEVIQGRMAGSHWVVALCVASAIEGIIRLDPSFKATPSEFSASELTSAKEAVEQVSPLSLRSRITDSIAKMSQASPAAYLTALATRGLLTQEQLQAWKKVRNPVAHGNLFEPWGTEQEDQQLIRLVELFYRLTSLRIGYLT